MKPLFKKLSPDLPADILKKVEFVNYRDFYNAPTTVLKKYDPRTCAHNIVVTFNKDYEPCIFLTKRANGIFKGGIETPGGKVDGDPLKDPKNLAFVRKAIRTNAMRETFEETGLNAFKAKDCGFIEHGHTYYKPSITINYFITVVSRDAFKNLVLDPKEASAAYLLPIEKLLEAEPVSEQRAYDKNNIRKLVKLDPSDNKFYNYETENGKVVRGNEVPYTSIVVIEDNVILMDNSEFKHLAGSKKHTGNYSILRDGEALVDAIHNTLGDSRGAIIERMNQAFRESATSVVTSFEIVSERARAL